MYAAQAAANHRRLSTMHVVQPPRPPVQGTAHAHTAHASHPHAGRGQFTRTPWGAVPP